MTRSGETAPKVEALSLAGDALYVIPNVYEVDGRVYTHPLSARGFASVNSYVAIEGDAALVIDTGFTVHERPLLRALEQVLPPHAAVSVWALRVGEYNGSCNIRSILEAFHSETFYCSQDEGQLWVDFRADTVPYGEPTGRGVFDDVDCRRVGVGDTIRVGAFGREIDVAPAALRLLPTAWGYDPLSKTLFTSDAFTYLWSPSSAGPWIVQAGDLPSAEEVLDYHVNTRFWWLPGARVDELRRDVDEIFSSYDVDIIAPGFGSVIAGRPAVEEHRTLLDDVLVLAGRRPSVGVAFGRRRAELS